VTRTRGRFATTAGVATLAVIAALVVGGAAAAHEPTRAQKRAITAALRSQQGNVGIQKVLISSADPAYARIGWGFTNGGFAAQHDSVLGLAGGSWKVLWTRDVEAPADGACIYVPSAVARDLLQVRCPPAGELHARAATKVERALIDAGFHASVVTPYSKASTGLAHVCVSRASPTWAGAVANFTSGARVYIFFRHVGRRWTPTFESLLQQRTPPPQPVLLSLASCVGYNPSDYNA
jgi:hypothetical protein